MAGSVIGGVNVIAAVLERVRESGYDGVAEGGRGSPVPLWREGRDPNEYLISMRGRERDGACEESVLEGIIHILEGSAFCRTCDNAIAPQKA